MRMAPGFAARVRANTFRKISIIIKRCTFHPDLQHIRVFFSFYHHPRINLTLVTLFPRRNRMTNFLDRQNAIAFPGHREALRQEAHILRLIYRDELVSRIEISFTAAKGETRHRARGIGLKKKCGNIKMAT